MQRLRPDGSYAPRKPEESARLADKKSGLKFRGAPESSLRPAQSSEFLK
jgi:hypothetical protein